jgi:hypothetical protein
MKSHGRQDFPAKKLERFFFFEVGVFQDFQDFRKLAGDFRGTSKTEDMVNL